MQYQAREFYIALIVSAEEVSKGAVISLDTKSPGYLNSIRPLRPHLGADEFQLLEHLPNLSARIHTNPETVGKHLSDLPAGKLVVIVEGNEVIKGLRADGVPVYKRMIN